MLSAAELSSDARLPDIPVYDVGTNFPMEIAQCVGERRGYEQLRMATANVPQPVLRTLDRLSRSWLVRNRSRYLREIDALAGKSREPGLYFLNVDYEWGCTTAARPHPNRRSALLQRTLDWDVDGIGRYVVAARIANPLGAWISLTWPAFTGVIQAMAPGRFAAALNQPMPTRHVGVLAIDRLIDKLQIWSSRHIQPIHLLRRVFETAPDYKSARAMLMTTPITTPAIFTLAGIRADETIVIERRSNDARAMRDAFAANEWRSSDWQPDQHPATENDARLEALRHAPAEWDADFDWVAPPLLNKETRLAMMAEPASGRLMARGYEACQPATSTLLI